MMQGRDKICRDCPRYYKPDADKRNCIQDTCSQVQRLSETGSCVSCPSNQIADERDNTRCISSGCIGNQYIDINGNCIDCPEYQIVDFTSKSSCVFPVCGKDQTITKNGQCICPYPLISMPDGITC